MNYYERWLGNYAKKTAHLCLIDHGSYTLLLDEYYAKERPLPSDYPTLYRICRAMASVEQKSVRKVADEFFPISPDGLRHNDRADRELTKAAPKINAARVNGRHGGRPRKNPPGSGQETHGEPTGLLAETHWVPTEKPRNNPAETHLLTHAEELSSVLSPHTTTTSLGGCTDVTVEAPLPGNLTTPTWAAWRAHLTVKGKGMTPQQERLQLVRLTEHVDPEAVVSRAIERGYANLEPVGGHPSDQSNRRRDHKTLAEERASNIDSVIANEPNQRHERTIAGTAERVNSAVVLTLPSDLRKQG